MQEQATLDYIKQIAGNDASYRVKLLQIIKTEFPEEKKQFLTYYKQEKYIKSAEIVHKLKHKINILGLEKGYELAGDFENQLKENNTSLYLPFYEVLTYIETYLNSL